VKQAKSPQTRIEIRFSGTTKILRGTFINQQAKVGVVTTLFEAIQFEIRKQWRGHVQKNESLEIRSPHVHHKAL
jgi:hypothetical protein